LFVLIALLLTVVVWGRLFLLIVVDKVRV